MAAPFVVVVESPTPSGVCCLHRRPACIECNDTGLLPGSQTATGFVPCGCRDAKQHRIHYLERTLEDVGKELADWKRVTGIDDLAEAELYVGWEGTLKGRIEILQQAYSGLLDKYNMTWERRLAFWFRCLWYRWDSFVSRSRRQTWR